MRPYTDPALQTGHFICYHHRTHHVLPTTGIWMVDTSLALT